MAYEGRNLGWPFPAAGDRSGDQFKIVDLDGSDELVLAGAGAGIGVLVDTPDAQGKYGTVVIQGITKVIAGAALGAGVSFMSNASGLAVASTATNAPLGITLTAASGANELVTVLLAVNGAVA